MFDAGLDSGIFADFTYQLMVAKSNVAVKQIFLLARPGLSRKYWYGGLRLKEPAQFRFLDMLLKRGNDSFYYTEEEALVGAKEFQALSGQQWER